MNHQTAELPNIEPMPAAPEKKERPRKTDIRRYHLTDQQRDQVREALSEWCAQGNRMWCNELMATLIGAQLRLQVTAAHIWRARVMLDLEVTRGAPSAADHETYRHALAVARGEIVPEPARLPVTVEGTLLAWRAEVEAVDAKWSARLARVQAGAAAAA